MPAKFIFMTGGVCSGLGKGITAASLGRLLKARGFKVSIQKFDPYLNMHPGLLSPYQHGEVYVTEDGAEVDLDLGHYERFIDENLTADDSVSAGRIYWEVLNKELQGAYKGATIQVIPHITDAIKSRIYKASKHLNTDIIISEIGGTVGDIESLPFLEAIRQASHDLGYENVMYVHVTLVPFLSFADEMKSKPTQRSVKDLLSLGIKPDALVCRTEKPLTDEIREKLALFCNVDKASVIENQNVDRIYEVPLLLEEERLADIVCKRLGLNPPPPDLSEWCRLVEKSKNLKAEVNIGLVGKYIEFKDSYLSVVEAMMHAGIFHNAKVNLKWIHAEEINDKNAASHLDGMDGVLVPGGYGDRGVAGLISAVGYAREKGIPFFGIGLGMQCALIEFARSVMNLPDADTTEINKNTKSPIVRRINTICTETNDETTAKISEMRLGAFPINLAHGTIIHEAYGESQINERFRHLYKINNDYRKGFAAKGIVESALSPDNENMEAFELTRATHPWFLGVQFHPEFKSRLTKPGPLFKAFVGACLDYKP